MATYTIAELQTQFNAILSDMAAGTVTEADICMLDGDAPVGKMFDWATFEAADVASTSDVVYIPQIEFAKGPMAFGNGPYSLAFRVNEAAAIPNNTAHASLTVTETDDSIEYVAVDGGAAGNDIEIVHAVAGNNTPLSVGVVGTVITVNIETDGGGLPISLASEVADAVNLSAPASALVTATAFGPDTDVITAMASTPLAGGGPQPAGTDKFKAFAVYREASSAVSGDVPALSPVAVIISNAHATFLGL